MDETVDDKTRELTDAIDQAIAARDAGALLAAIKEADRAPRDGPNPEVRLFADGLALLLVRGGFAAFLAGAQSALAEPAAVHRVINSRAGRLEGQQLADLVAAVGAPPPKSARTRLLSNAIIHNRDPRVTESLAAFIRLHGQDNAGEWVVADTVATLALRPGEQAAAALIHFLDELPWHDNGYASAALLEGMLRHPEVRCLQAISDALTRQGEADAFRLMLLAAEHTIAPDAAMERLLKDLHHPLPPGLHWDYVLLLKAWLGKSNQLPSTAAALRELSIADWPQPIRVLFILMLHRLALQQAAPAGISRNDRLLALLVAGFEHLRMRAKGYYWILPALFFAAIGISAALNALLGAPPVLLQRVNAAFVLFWMLALIVASPPQFTADERPGRILFNAVLFWLATLLLIASVIGTRLYGHIAGG